MDALKQLIDKKSRLLISAEEKMKIIQEDIAELEKHVQQLPEEVEFTHQVQVYLQTLSEKARENVIGSLEGITSMCIKAVFGDEYSFKIEVVTKNNNTAIEFYVVETIEGEEMLLPPEDNFGGGMVDVISIALRFGLFEVLEDKPAPFIILDEPAKMVSGDKIESIAELIKELQRVFNVQVIMVTHHETLAGIGDETFLLTKKKGKTILEGETL